MRERHVIVHSSVIREWLGRKNVPLDRDGIERALRKINAVINTFGDDVVVVEESPDTGFVSLPGRVGVGNSARLYGARAGTCLVIAREVLEKAGIPVSLDEEAVLP